MTSVEAGKPLVFVPCLFFGSSMYLEFDDLVVIGTGVGPGDVEARARTEAVARRVKALADPTRLALLHSLATAPSTVGELATLFRLAQPTVSMHVKVLRQSGLVRSERQGGTIAVAGRRGGVETLLGDLRQAVLQGTAGDSTTGSDLMPATVVESTRSAGPVTAIGRETAPAAPRGRSSPPGGPGWRRGTRARRSRRRDGPDSSGRRTSKRAASSPKIRSSRLPDA